MGNRFILTARMDSASQAFFDELRGRHFPAERNYLQSHLTLFHALPESELERIDRQIRETAACYGEMAGHVAGLRSLGRGVAFEVECAPLRAVRREWARGWDAFLTSQDRQMWWPHITVQNKVSAEEARRLLDELRRNFAPQSLQFDGLNLWRYDGGPWSPARRYVFAAAAHSEDR